MSENGKYRVLVVDDNPAVRAVFLEFVASLGYDVFAAENGEAALLAVASIRPHLLLTDYNMTQMTGDVLAGYAKRIVTGIKVIMVTARLPEEIAESAASASIDRVLQKPVNLEDLTAAIQEVLAMVA